ncbi:dipeptidase [Halonatronum saccharophilum]|uniref:dipeptidase n=1 Tax=Halonatronum saccharophilum TaxID=150060 RepID=UPI0004835D8E|nr:dipeptidase [Halonatronum saccharophilum]
MKLIDLHCDTISRIFYESGELKANDFQVDLNKLKKGGAIAQFFALYLDLKEEESLNNDPSKTCLNMLDLFYNEIEKNSNDIALARNYCDLKANSKKNKISAFLTIEEGGVLGDSLYNLRNFYRLGIRLITLTWNYPNSLGYPNSDNKFRDTGLTPFGKEVIREMNRLGILIDVSHLSDGGFYDVAQLSSQPFIASHSNARSLRDHSRNLSDQMIKILSNKGGVVGINFASDFLIGGEKSYIRDIIRHIKHIRDTAGIEVIALGSDFDGISSKLEIENIGQMNKLYYALKKEKFSEDQIEKIFFKNAQRVIREVL